MKTGTKKWKLRGWAILALAAMSVPLVAKAVTSRQNERNADWRDEGVISGYKFKDLNANGVDDGEPRLPGVRILLVGLDDPSIRLSTITDHHGEFAFTDLPRGRYEVCEVALPPLSPTTPECVNVDLFGKVPEAEVVFGNRVLPSPSPSPSVSPSPSPSPSVSPTPSPTPTGCVRTQGFWGSSPAGQALLQALVPGTLSLGNHGYTSAQLLSILGTPAGGNALLILADQLIAAKLNILAGADGSAVATTIAQADAAIGNLVVGTDTVAPNSPLGQTMVSLAATLDQYNNGQLGVPHCP